MICFRLFLRRQRLALRLLGKSSRLPFRSFVRFSVALYFAAPGDQIKPQLSSFAVSLFFRRSFSSGAPAAWAKPSGGHCEELREINTLQGIASLAAASAAAPRQPLALRPRLALLIRRSIRPVS
jgi:hypothetical protein